MALTKVTYVNGVTVITAENLNDIQDAIIELEQSGAITVDSAMSGSSTNPVQNKVIYAALLGYLPLAGGTMTGALAMGGYKVTGLGAGSANTDAVTKKQLDDAIAGIGTVFNIKGDVATVADLPATGNAVGDVYYVQAVSAAYVWLETTAQPTGYWEEFGEPIDLSGYIEKPASPTIGDFLCFNGSEWAATTVPSANGVSF